MLIHKKCSIIITTAFQKKKKIYIATSNILYKYIVYNIYHNNITYLQVLHISKHNIISFNRRKNSTSTIDYTMKKTYQLNV